MSGSAPLLSTPALWRGLASVWWVDAVLSWARRRECSFALAAMQSFAVQGLHVGKLDFNRVIRAASPKETSFQRRGKALRKTISVLRCVQVWHTLQLIARVV
jgi:hypothetical protein